MVRKIALLAAGLAGLLVVLEVIVRLLLNPEALCRPFLCQDDAAWRLWWVARHRPDEAIMYRFDVHHPTRGWALRPGLDAIPVFDGKVLSSNSQGFRGRREYAPEKPPGVTRIVALGDSFMFGEEVSDEETLTSRLAERAPAIEAMNLGVHGYGHDQMLLYLRDVGLAYRPDVVLLGFVGEDMHRNLLSFRDFAKPRFVLNEHQQLSLAGVPVDPPEAVLAGEFWRPKLLDLATVLWQALRWRSGVNQRDAERITRAILATMVEETRAAGAEPVFVFFPVGEELLVPKGVPIASEDFLAALARELGVKYLSLRPALARAAQRGEQVSTHWHWSPRAHEIAAVEIARFLDSSGPGRARRAPSQPAHP